MSSSYRSQRLLAVVAASGVLAAGAFSALAAPPAASADPGGPTTVCESQDLGSVCDGPIRPDNTFDRCRVIGALYIGKGRFLPARDACWMVDLSDTPNFGADLPQHHIGG